MRKFTLLLIGLVFTMQLSAQDSPKTFEFNFYPSIHFGFFSPEDVNQYIADDLSSYTVTFGTTDLIMNFNIGAGLGFRFLNLVEIQPQVEYSIAPKVISGANSYSYSKFSGGMMANFMIPIAPNRKSSIIVGGGMFYNTMSFEEYSGSSMNPRVQAGLSLNNNRFNPQIIFAYDLAKATVDEAEYFELDYSSFRIGVNLNF
ncbi:MAG: hypothetical protein KAR57_02775 [Bacteroidales bacterium]|nr:hypothetical protein [Bacteroidales bacterium]